MLGVPQYGKGLAQSNVNRTERKSPLEELRAGLAAQQERANAGEPFGQAAELKQLSADGKRASIKAKLQGGNELTDEELEYLRKTDPDLYQKAIEIKAEREQYRKDLERCRTREAVELLFARKQQIFLSEIRSVKRCIGISKEKTQELMEQISARRVGIWKEHVTFKESVTYKSLPRERDLEETEESRRKHGQAQGKRQKAGIDVRA